MNSFRIHKEYENTFELVEIRRTEAGRDRLRGFSAKRTQVISSGGGILLVVRCMFETFQRRSSVSGKYCTSLRLVYEYIM